jgi:hypothetical protein
VVCDGLGSTTITLNNANLPHVLLDPNHVTVTLQGQTDAAAELAASTMSPVMIVINGNTVTTLNLNNNNTRPIIVGIKKAFGLTSLTVNCNTVSTFRLILIAEETPMTIDCNARTVSIKGGIFTDRNLIQNNDGALSIIQEDSPSALSAIAPRWVWVEGYQQ